MGFERLGELTGIPAKSLMRMLGPKGNPQARNLLDVIGHLAGQLSTSGNIIGKASRARAPTVRRAGGIASQGPR